MRLFRLYQLVHQVNTKNASVCASAQSCVALQQARQLSAPMNIYMHTASTECILSWVCEVKHKGAVRVAAC